MGILISFQQSLSNDKSDLYLHCILCTTIKECLLKSMFSRKGRQYQFVPCKSYYFYSQQKSKPKNRSIAKNFLIWNLNILGSTHIVISIRSYQSQQQVRQKYINGINIFKFMRKPTSPKKMVKQSALTPDKKCKSTHIIHKKTISLLEERPNITLMKWNNFLASYHQAKHIATINSNFSTISTHFKQKNYSFTIQDVPYILSQQILQSENQYPLNATKSLNELNLSIDGKDDTMQEQEQFCFDSSKQNAKILQENILAEIDQQENKESKKYGIKRQLNYGKQSKKILTDFDSECEDEENFTDEDEQEENCSHSVKFSKNSISTKNSKLYTMLESKAEESWNQCDCQNLKQTAHFTDEKIDPNIQNKDSQNKLQSRKLLILRKIQQQRIKNSKERSSLIKEDKKFLDQLLWK